VSAELSLGVIGSVVTLAFLFEMMRRYHLREKYAVLWAVVAMGTLVVAVFPGLLRWAAGVLGVEVASNLLFFLASLVLLVVSIHQSYELGRLEERTRTLAEEIALVQMHQRSRGEAGRGSTDVPRPRPPTDGDGSG
jgi:hypothetical protein